MVLRSVFVDAARAIMLGELLDATEEEVRAAIILGVTVAEAELRIPGLFDPEAVRFASQFPFTSLRRVSAEVGEDIRNVLTVALREGLGQDETARRLRRVLKAKRHRLRAIARTEMNRAANHGRLTAWTRSGVVKEKIAVATHDDRVRASHLAADGERVPVGEPFTRGAAAGRFAPPWEPNCRCTIRPVTRFTGLASEAAQEEIPGLLTQERVYERRLLRAWRAFEVALLEELRNERETRPSQLVVA